MVWLKINWGFLQEPNYSNLRIYGSQETVVIKIKFSFSGNQIGKSTLKGKSGIVYMFSNNYCWRCWTRCNLSVCDYVKYVFSASFWKKESYFLCNFHKMVLVFSDRESICEQSHKFTLRGHRNWNSEIILSMGNG